jgi:hypothetical protein
MNRTCSTDKYGSHADRILFYKLSEKSAPTASLSECLEINVRSRHGHWSPCNPRQNESQLFIQANSRNQCKHDRLFTSSPNTTSTHSRHNRWKKKTHGRISEAYALTHPAASLHIHRHITVVMRTHFSRTLLAFTHATLQCFRVLLMDQHTHTPIHGDSEGRISTTTFHISLLCTG